MTYLRRLAKNRSPWCEKSERTDSWEFLGNDSAPQDSASLKRKKSKSDLIIDLHGDLDMADPAGSHRTMQ